MEESSGIESVHVRIVELASGGLHTFYQFTQIGALKLLMMTHVHSLKE